MHVRLHPIHSEDRKRFRRVRNRMNDIGYSRIQKRLRIQKRYRQGNRPRIYVHFRTELVESTKNIGREVDDESFAQIALL